MSQYQRRRDDMTARFADPQFRPLRRVRLSNPAAATSGCAWSAGGSRFAALSDWLPLSPWIAILGSWLSGPGLPTTDEEIGYPGERSVCLPRGLAQLPVGACA